MKKQKKRIEFCEKVIQMKFEGKKIEDKIIFFNDETRIDIAPNTSDESIRISVEIKNKLKKVMKKVID